MVNTGWNIFGNSNQNQKTSKEALNESKIQKLIKGSGLNIGIETFEELKMIINNLNNIVSQLGNSPLSFTDGNTYKFGLSIRNKNNNSDVIDNKFVIKSINDINLLHQELNKINNPNYPNLDLYITINFGG